ncbi:uncharacterized protein LOC111049791 isoform X4 [Nilaparvata lugens]|uniref:uncharacterized protein LOC111049791 isoform X4 n=1 Tax=Nilaparvata lugens TaxID=108931 RepID=UPI00193EB536|nr:uncharacterized protein LOC111049791 isoform X4 [Nilaparvata lugens]
MDSFDNESLKSNQDEIMFSSSSEIEIKLPCSGGKLVGSDSCGESIVSHFQSINIPFGKENKPQKKFNAKQRSHMQSANIKIRKNFDRETDKLEKLSSPMSPTPIQLGNRFEHLSEGHISSQLFEMENETLNVQFDLHSGSASDSIFGNCFSNMSKCLNDKNLASNVIDAGSPEQASTNYDLTLDDMWNSLDDGRELTPIDKSLSFNIASLDDDYEMIKSDDSLAELMKKPKSNCAANNVVVGIKKHRHFDDEESLASSLNSSFNPKRRKPNTDGAVDKCVLCVTTKENVSSQTTNVTDDTAKSIASIKKQIWDWQEQSNSFLKPNRTSWMGTSNPLAADLMQLRIPDQDATMDEGGQQNLNILPDIEFSSMEY